MHRSKRCGQQGSDNSLDDLITVSEVLHLFPLPGFILTLWAPVRTWLAADPRAKPQENLDHNWGEV